MTTGDRSADDWPYWMAAPEAHAHDPWRLHEAHGEATLITLYTSATPNGYRASLMLEESGLEYDVHPIDMAAGAHKTEDFLKLNATGRIPAIVDDTIGLSLAETLAIAVYVSEVSGRLMPAEIKARALAWQWGAIVVSGFGSALPGIFFSRQLDAPAHEKIIAKYFRDIDGYLAAMDARLIRSEYLAGDACSFADILALPTVVKSLVNFAVDLTPYEGILRWRDTLIARPAVVKGFTIPQA